MSGEWTQRLVDRLDAVNAEEREEESHREADSILLDAVHPEVRAAYLRVRERAGGWWYA